MKGLIMTLTAGDRAECKEIGREIVESVMEKHIASCPHGLLLTKSKAWIVGMSVGVGVSAGVGGGGIVYTLVHALSGA